MDAGAIGVLVGQLGFPIAIAIFLLWWVLVKFDKSVKQVSKDHKEGLVLVSRAITTQTKTLNHTLSEQIELIKLGITNQASKADVSKICKHKR